MLEPLEKQQQKLIELTTRELKKYLEDHETVKKYSSIRNIYVGHKLNMFGKRVDTISGNCFIEKKFKELEYN